MKLELSYYNRPSVTEIAKNLLGKHICTFIDNQLTSGIIIETEAYEGTTDRASHAYNFRKTTRTNIMYQPGGIAYVYLCYGIHHLFNIVTNTAGIPHAVLLRSIHPVDGIKIMEKRRRIEIKKTGFTDGPGKVTQALGITISHNGENLLGNGIWIEDRDYFVDPNKIVSTPRIGVDYAGEHAQWPYRFLINID